MHESHIYLVDQSQMFLTDVWFVGCHDGISALRRSLQAESDLCCLRPSYLYSLISIWMCGSWSGRSFPQFEPIRERCRIMRHVPLSLRGSCGDFRAAGGRSSQSSVWMWESGDPAEKPEGAALLGSISATLIIKTSAWIPFTIKLSVLLSWCLLAIIYRKETGTSADIFIK